MAALSANSVVLAALERSLSRTRSLAGGLDKFAAQYKAGVTETMRLCVAVQRNCFVNASFDPSRGGSCPLSVWSFRFLGFERENLPRGFPYSYPW